MVLAAGNEVAYTQTGASYGLRNASFAFGIIVDDSADPLFDVLWENGTRSDGIPGLQLDKIEAVGALPAGLVVSVGNSPEYYGILVRAYNRDNNDAGVLVPVGLVRLLSSGQLLEVPFASIDTVTGR